MISIWLHALFQTVWYPARLTGCNPRSNQLSYSAVPLQFCRIRQITDSCLLVLLIGIVFLGLPRSSWADSIRTTGGQLIEGRIIKERKDKITIQTQQGIFKVRTSDILEIQRDKAGDPQLIRAPRNQNSPAILAARSFIPFYSGIFELEEQSWGVPFAALNGFGFLYFINHQMRHVASDGYAAQNPESFASEINLTGYILAYSSSLNLSSFNEGYLGTQYLTYSVAYNFYPGLQEAQPRFFGSNTTVSQSNNIKATALQVYLLSSTLNALLSYYLAGGLDSGGEAAGKTPSRERVFVYAFPQPGGMLFGLTLAF